MLPLRVRNTSGKTVQVPFSSSQQFDFEVWRDNRLLWRWGDGRSFTQALGSLTVEPGPMKSDGPQEAGLDSQYAVATLQLHLTGAAKGEDRANTP